MSAVTSDQIVDALKTMTLLEVKELVTKIEETFGVSAAPAMGAMMMPAGAGGAAAPAAEEKTEFTVTLVEAPAAEKIKIIKAVRALTGLGLKEAKDLVEAAPKEVVKDVSKDDAAKAKKELEESGAKVEVK